MVADVSVYALAGVEVDVIAGLPPLDQTELVASLTLQVVDLTKANTALQAKIDAARAAAQSDKDADAASASGQAVLDALA